MEKATPNMSNYETIFKEFESLRRDRWALTESLLQDTEEIDDLLADVSNVVTLIYVTRKLGRTAKEGFVSNDRRKSTS